MARRGLALAFALIVATAPVASDMCRIFCAREQPRSADPPQHHHSSDVPAEDSHYHHHQGNGAAPISPAAVHAVAHSCPELNSIVVVSRDSVRDTAAMAVLVTPGVLFAVRRVSSAIVVDRRHGPPGSTRSIAQLRI